MPKARKLKSGNWNIQVFDYRDPSGKGHYTSITAPTKLECEIKARVYQKDHPQRDASQDMTVGAAVDRYLSLCGTLSPTTSDRYNSLRKNAFQSLMDTPVKKLTTASVQAAINAECLRPSKNGTVSAKTVKNGWGLISAALHKICGLTFDVSLPKAKRQIKQYPDPQVVLDAIMHSSVKLPCLLSMWCTFSLSEILGIKCSSIKDGCVYIDQVRVTTKDGLVEKSVAKTLTRNRAQRIPEYLMDLIWQTDTYQRYLNTGQDDYLISTPRSTIYHAWKRASKGLGLSFHDLRHMSASVMLQLNIPGKYAQERGGWATDHVMKTVYQHTFSAERLAIDAKINDYFEKSLNAQSEREREKA